MINNKIEETIKKLKRVEKRVSREKGPLNFFGVLERLDVDNTWDILVSASWFSDKKKDLIYIISNVKKDLTNEDLRIFARVVLIKPEEKFIRRLNALIETEHKEMEIINMKINGFRLKHGYIITSKGKRNREN